MSCNIITGNSPITSITSEKNIYIGDSDVNLLLDKIQYFADSFSIGNQSSENIKVFSFSSGLADARHCLVFPQQLLTVVYDENQYVVAGVTNMVSAHTGTCVLSTSAAAPITNGVSLTFTTVSNNLQSVLDVTNNLSGGGSLVTNISKYRWLVVAKTNFNITNIGDTMTYELSFTNAEKYQAGVATINSATSNTESVAAVVLDVNTSTTLRCVVITNGGVATRIADSSYITLEFYLATSI